jgi:hypothetical protein
MRWGESGSRGEGGRGGECARERMLGANTGCRLGLDNQSQQTTGAGGRGLGCSRDKPPASAGLRVGCWRRKRARQNEQTSLSARWSENEGVEGGEGLPMSRKGQFFSFSRWKAGKDRAEALSYASSAIWISPRALGHIGSAAIRAQGSQPANFMHALRLPAADMGTRAIRCLAGCTGYKCRGVQPAGWSAL